MVKMMICGLFSSFDPSSFSFEWLNIKWVSFILILCVLWWQNNILPLGKDILVKKVFLKIVESISDTLFRPYLANLMLLNIFMCVFSMNLWGLLPFLFSISSHLSVNLSFSLSLWMGGVVLMIFSSIEKLLAHVVPVGCPTFLWPLLVLVESVSILIRPFTLSIRLMANVMSGHLILSLVGEFFKYQMVLFPISFPFLGFFLLFEVCISSVQAYVFMSLLSLYWKESEEEF